MKLKSASELWSGSQITDLWPNYGLTETSKYHNADNSPLLIALQVWWQSFILTTPKWPEFINPTYVAWVQPAGAITSWWRLSCGRTPAPNLAPQPLWHKLKMHQPSSGTKINHLTNEYAKIGYSNVSEAKKEAKTYFYICWKILRKRQTKVFSYISLPETFKIQILNMRRYIGSNLIFKNEQMSSTESILKSTVRTKLETIIYMHYISIGSSPKNK